MAGSWRQVIVLGLLAVALTATAWWQLRGEPAEPAPAVESEADVQQRQQTDAASARAASRVPRVELALLNQEPAEPVDTGRDPFRFGARRRGAGGAPSGEAAAGLERPAARPAPAVATGPPPPPPLPPIPMKFIGLVQKQGEKVRIAVLSDGRGVYHGREGDVIEGRYRILRIGDDVVEMAYLDGRGRQVIRLSGA